MSGLPRRSGNGVQQTEAAVTTQSRPCFTCPVSRFLVTKGGR
jgi:hypothetical protein